MISHDHKIIFLHIPKCAGRSICNAFNQRFDHFTANYYIREYSEYWSAYNKFTIVRNPYDRYVSIYHYIKEHRRHAMEPIGFEGNIPSFKQWLITNIQNYQGDFYKASAEGMRGTDGEIGSSFWFSSQVRRLSDNHNNIYKSITLIPFESGMTSVNKFLFDNTGISFNLQHQNQSKHYYYLNYYDDELLNTVNNFQPFKEDCTGLSYPLFENENELVA